MPIVKVCFSPMLYPLYAAKETVTVVVDVLRATSAICTAFEHGIARVIPVPDVEDTYFYKDHDDVIVAAERGGEVVEGFSYGNSPFSYMNDEIKGKTLVITTTNGTQAIEAAKDSQIILVGSFLNFDALTENLRNIDRDVMVLCAGWKNRFNLEDTLFAGAVTENLLEAGFSYATDSDAALASLSLYKSAKYDLFDFLENSSHRNRLERLNLEEDVKYCLSFNKTRCVPYLKGDSLIDASKNGGLELLKSALQENKV
ncbi:MAG: 2-phosphosulfolactate phosphatase [Flavobacteriales bacterium]|nr:2-phosphosulfolactate phosphatase [Flavobacteriales bacterium]